MPLTSAGSPLVSGGLAHTTMKKQPDTLTGRVLRAFLVQGEPVKVGAEVTLDRRLAVELAAANKLELLKPEAAAQAAIADLKPGTNPKPSPAKTAGKES